MRRSRGGRKRRWRHCGHHRPSYSRMIVEAAPPPHPQSGPAIAPWGMNQTGQWLAPAGCFLICTTSGRGASHRAPSGSEKPLEMAVQRAKRVPASGVATADMLRRERGATMILCQMNLSYSRSSNAWPATPGSRFIATSRQTRRSSRGMHSTLGCANTLRCKAAHRHALKSGGGFPTRRSNDRVFCLVACRGACPRCAHRSDPYVTLRTRSE
jgi:hypothetical protein